MFRLLERLFGVEPEEDIYETVDRLNAEAHGGPPRLESGSFGTLEVPSRSVVINDPMSMPDGVLIDDLPSAQINIAADVWRYPSGAMRIARLVIFCGDGEPTDAVRELGTIGIDSAKVVLADAEAARAHWADTGVDRIGVVSTVRNQKARQRLKKRFNLKTVQTNALRAETVEPVSEELEREIEAYLETIPEYAKYSFLYFNVQTNNSFDRVNFSDAKWQFLPVGNQPSPLMFACNTGYGDGTYTIEGHFAADFIQSITIEFIRCEEG